tara:strand:- start:1472 stop:2551 length:1080 start_codon:yes stop_codon:yes gene_type:complete
MNITSDIGKQYDNIHSIYSDIVADTKTSIVEKNKPPSPFENLLLYLLNWKIVFGVTVSLILVFVVVSDKAVKYLASLNRYNSYGLNMMSFFVYGLVINMFISLFIFSFYFYKKKIIGGKGPKGDLGEKGLQGKDDLCNICTLKPQRIKRSKKLMETTLVDEPEKMEELNNTKKGWHKDDVELVIGDSRFCNKCETKKYVYQPDIKYITGVIANFNESKNFIDSFQFIYKDINNSTKLQGGQDGKWGDKKNNVTELLCPSNSAVYRIDSMYLNSNPKSNSSIGGIKIHCKDTKTNKKKEIKTTIGIDYDEGSGVYKHASLICKNKSQNGKDLQGFLADVSGTYDRTRMNQIQFSKCNYYH